MATRLLPRGLLPRRTTRISALRHRSDGPERPLVLFASLDVTESARRLEEAMDEMAVRKAAPPWLPLLPGASYWVPPRRRRADAGRVAEIIGSVAVPVAEGRTASIKRGRSNFAQGLPVPPHPVEEITSDRSIVKSDDDEA